MSLEAVTEWIWKRDGKFDSEMAQPDVGTPGLGHLPLKGQSTPSLYPDLLRSSPVHSPGSSQILPCYAQLMTFHWLSAAPGVRIQAFQMAYWSWLPPLHPFHPLHCVFPALCYRHICSPVGPQTHKHPSHPSSPPLLCLPTVLTPHLFPFCINSCSLLSLQAVWEGMS